MLLGRAADACTTVRHKRVGMLVQWHALRETARTEGRRYGLGVLQIVRVLLMRHVLVLMLVSILGEGVGLVVARPVQDELVLRHSSLGSALHFALVKALRVADRLAVAI